MSLSLSTSSKNCANHSISENYQEYSLFQRMIDELIDGIILLTEQQKVVWMNECAHRILGLLDHYESSPESVPPEIWHLCQTLIQSRDLFPGQHWTLETTIFVNDTLTFNVQCKWLRLSKLECPYLLLIVKDKYQSMKSIAMQEALKYELTPREIQVWLLHRAHYPYKRISAELGITPNTVKKHMKNIFSKQRQVLEN